MDEEELVLEFTEKRGLITLGWVRPISSVNTPIQLTFHF